MTINESGYRSTESWTKSAAFKVLWIGDSVTWGGSYIDDQDTFAELSCRRIEEATDLEAVCGNGAVNAYGVDNMVSRLRHDRAGETANVIVAVIGLPNFFRGVSTIGGQSWIEDPTPGPLPALRELATYYASRLLLLLQRGGDDGPSCDEAHGSSVAQASLAGLLQVLKEKQTAGAVVLLVRYALVHEVADADDSHLAHLPACLGPVAESELLLDLSEAVRASEVPYLDLTAAVREALNPDSTEPFFYDRASHLEIRGHRVYAQAISDRILELTGYAND